MKIVFSDVVSYGCYKDKFCYCEGYYCDWLYWRIKNCFVNCFCNMKEILNYNYLFIIVVVKYVYRI